MKGFYYIENSTDEWRSSETGFFETLDEAKEAMKYCSDWFCSEGTGAIYFQEFGIKWRNVMREVVVDGKVVEKERRVMDSTPRQFICRGVGLDENGNVIFSDKKY